MKPVLIVAGVMLFSLAALGQDCSLDDFESFTNVKSSVGFLMSHPGFILSWYEKAVMRAGDSAAIAILKMYSDEELASAPAAKQAASVVQMAFSLPRIISACSDRKPRATMLLLDHLLILSKDAETIKAIENAKGAITHQTIADVVEKPSSVRRPE